MSGFTGELDVYNLKTSVSSAEIGADIALGNDVAIVTTVSTTLNGKKLYINGTNVQLTTASNNLGYTVNSDLEGTGDLIFGGTRASNVLAGDNRNFGGTITVKDDGIPRNATRLSSYKAASAKAKWTVYNTSEGSSAGRFTQGGKNQVYQFGSLSGTVYDCSGNDNNYPIYEIGALGHDDDSLTLEASGGVGADSRGFKVRKVGDGTLTMNKPSKQIVYQYILNAGTLVVKTGAEAYLPEVITETTTKSVFATAGDGETIYTLVNKVTFEKAKATVTVNGTATALTSDYDYQMENGTLTFTVVADADYVVESVTAGTTPLTPDEGVYSVDVSANTTIKVTTADAGANVTVGGVTTSYATFAEAAAAATAASASGCTITARKNVTDTVTVGVDCTIYIPAGVTVNEISTTSAVTIDGAGTYSFTRGITKTDANDPVLNVTLATTWAGNVTINGGYLQGTTSDNNLDEYVNGTKSTVTLNGTHGYLGQSAVVTANIIIGEDGWFIDDGYSVSSKDTPQFTIEGSVSGKGTLDVTIAKRGSALAYVFTGDVSGWSGAVNASKAGTQKFFLFNGNPLKDGETSVKIGPDFTTTGFVTINVYITNTNPVTLAGDFDQCSANGLIRLFIDGDVTATSDSITMKAMTLTSENAKFTVPTTATIGLIETTLAGESVTEVTLDGMVHYSMTDADVFFYTDKVNGITNVVDLFINTDTAHPFTEDETTAYIADYEVENGGSVSFTIDSEYFTEDQIVITASAGDLTKTGTLASGYIYTLSGWKTGTVETVSIRASLKDTPDFPFNEGEADSTVKEKYAAWAGTYSHTDADGNAFLLNVAPTANTNLTVTAITISGTTVTIDTSHALENANGIVYVLSGTDLAHVTEITSDTKITKVEKTAIGEGGVITLTGETGATAEFYKVGVGYTLPKKPSAPSAE